MTYGTGTDDERQKLAHELRQWARAQSEPAKSIAVHLALMLTLHKKGQEPPGYKRFLAARIRQISAHVASALPR